MLEIKSILWRKLNRATLNTLRDLSGGQYHITLGTLKLDEFFDVYIPQQPTATQGYQYKIKLEAYISENPDESVGERELTIKYMGPLSSRKDWNIPAQRIKTAYPLWSVSRRVPKEGELNKSFLCIIRTKDDKYHGRLILEDEFENLPEILKLNFLGKELGILKMEQNYSTEAQKIYKELMKNYNVLLYGPPGTGKTTLMQEVLEIFNSRNSLYLDSSTEVNPILSADSSLKKTNSIWTTFHQSYSYEEFIMGLSTENAEHDKLLSITPKPGILLELAEFSRIDGNSSLLIIDELNRGNVSRIFGEFITLIEVDKRLDDNNNSSSKTVKVRLPFLGSGEELEFKTENGNYFFKNPFMMPKRVYTLASMNSVDKSTFPLDSALRRRFSRYDIYPDLELLANKMGINTSEISNPNSNVIESYKIDDIRKLSWKLLDYLNNKITIFKGEDYTIGHSYLWSLINEFESIEDIVEELNEVFIERIYPQLEELFRGRQDLLSHIFKVEDSRSFTPFKIVTPNYEEQEYGAIVSFSIERDKVGSSNIIDMILWYQKVSDINLIELTPLLRTDDTNETVVSN